MAENTTPCPHMNFVAQVNVARIEDIGRFAADITIRCADCGLPFQFLGLEAGLNLAGATVSVDGLEARMAIAPQGKVPSPLEIMGFRVRGNG